MANFPTSTPSFAGFTSSHTLAADNHAAQHNLEQGEIVALATKIGTGSSTPTSGTVLRGTGAGTSSWAQVALTTDVTGVLPQANGGTGTTLSTGTGKVVYDTSPTISAPTFTGGGSWAGSPSLTTPTLTTPTIADFTSSQHGHTNAAGGGTLVGNTAIQAATLKAAQMFKGLIYQRQGGNSLDLDWAAGGTTNTDISAKDVFIQAGSTGTINGNITVTFPVAFNAVPIVIAVTASALSTNCFTLVPGATKTTCTIRQIIDTGVAATTENAYWMAIGV